MSRFESFVQLELPKRPFLEDDVPEEAIIVRRGEGPRQLNGILLEEGQVLTMQDGKLTPVQMGTGGTGSSSGISVERPSPELEWIINHNRNSKRVVVTVLDSNHEAILYDSLKVEEDQITIKFYEPQSGFANIVFV